MLLLVTLSTAAIAQTSPPPTGKVASEFGIPGEVPVDDVWRHLLAESDLPLRQRRVESDQRVV